MKNFIKFSYCCGFLVLLIMVHMGKYYIFPKEYSELVTVAGRVVSTNLNGGIEIETEQNNRIRLFCDDVSMNLATSKRVRTNGNYGSCQWVVYRFKRYNWCENKIICSASIGNIIKNSYIEVLINDKNMIYELILGLY